MEEASAVLAQHLEGHIKSLERRNLWFTLVNMLVNLVLAAGLLELLYPDLVGGVVDFRPTLRQLSTALFVLVGLIFLFNLLALARLGAVRRARADMVRELARRDAVEKVTMVDAVTGTFDRRYLDELIPRETARADRRETALSFVKLSVDDFDAVDSRLGFEAAERVLVESAQMLKRSFRPTDIVIRYGRDEFLVVMPETAKHGALTAVRRLLSKVDEWNRKKVIPGYEMGLSVGVADYKKGMDVRDALAAAETRVQLFRDQQAPGA